MTRSRRVRAGPLAVRSKCGYAVDAVPDPGSAIIACRWGCRAMKPKVYDEGGYAAVREIVAGIVALRGPPGLEELVVDLARALAEVVERIATVEDLAVEDVANDLFFGEDPAPGVSPR